MNTVNIKLYNILKNDFKLPDAKAHEFVGASGELMQTDIKESANEYKSIVKEDLQKIDVNIQRLEINMQKLETKIAEAKADTIKWMFAFWIGSIGIGLLFFFLKK